MPAVPNSPRPRGSATNVARPSPQQSRPAGEPASPGHSPARRSVHSPPWSPCEEPEAGSQEPSPHHLHRPPLPPNSSLLTSARCPPKNAPLVCSIGGHLADVRRLELG